MRTMELGRGPRHRLSRLGQTPADSGNDEALVFPDGTAIQYIVRQTKNGPAAFPEDAQTTTVFQQYQDALGRFHSAWQTGHTNDPSIGCEGNPNSPVLKLDAILGQCTLASAQAAVKFMRRQEGLTPPTFPSPSFPVFPASADDLARQSGLMTTVLLQMAAAAPGQRTVTKRRKLGFFRRRGAAIAALAAFWGIGSAVLVAKERESAALG